MWIHRFILPLFLLKPWSVAGEIVLGVEYPITLSAGSGYSDTIYNLPPGTTVICSTKGAVDSQSDPRLTLLLANYVEFDDCIADLSVIGDEECVVGPLGGDPASVFVDVYANSDLSITLECRETTPAPTQAPALLEFGTVIPLDNYRAGSSFTGSSPVVAETKVFCQVSGDTQCLAKLTMKMVGSDGQTEYCDGVGVYACGDESCSTGPLTVDSEVVVEVEAKEAFTGVGLLCTQQTCTATGRQCNESTFCCENLVCDGPGPARQTCKLPVRPGGRCTRDSQCSPDYFCSNRRCVLL